MNHAAPAHGTPSRAYDRSVRVAQHVRGHPIERVEREGYSLLETLSAFLILPVILREAAAPL